MSSRTVLSESKIDLPKVLQRKNQDSKRLREWSSVKERKCVCVCERERESVRV